MAEINIYDYDFLLGASINAQQQVFDAVANAGPISLTGTTSQIVGFDLYGNPMPKNVGGDANGAGLAFVGDTLTATLPQNLKPLGAPTFAGLTLTNQTANRLLFASAAQAVASTGITYDAGTVTIGSVQSIDFATSPTNSIATQRLQWSDTEGTLALGLKGGKTAAHLGLDHLTRIVNKTGADLLRTEYRVIRAGNSQGVNRMSGVLAQANTEPNSTDVLGIVCENISNNQEGFIMTWGEVSGIDTTGAAYGETGANEWNEGDTLYLSPSTYGGKAGALTKIKPKAPDHLVIIGYVTSKNANNGRILVHVQTSWETGELHDVQFGTSMPLAGSLLIRDATLNVWKPAQLSAGSNVTITNADGAVTIAAAPGMVYPGAGIPVSTGSAWGTSKAAPTGDIVGTTDGQILSNKTLSGPTITGQLTLSNGTGAVGQVVTRNAGGLLWANVTPGVTNGDKGDITVSNAGTGSENWAIDPGVVTYAKIQNVTPDRLLGRVTSPAGTVEEIACTAAGRALLDDADAAAQRTTLGLSVLSTQSLTAGSNITITNPGTPGSTVTIASTGGSAGREVLTADRTYFVGFNLGACTIPSGTPAVVQRTGHGLAVGNAVIFSASPGGTMAGGIIDGATYYVKANSVNPNDTFQISLTPGGPSVSSTGGGSSIIVRTGSDSSTGLTNATGANGAFLTIEKALNVVAAIDLSGFAVTIQLANGRYVETVRPKSYVGSGPVTIQGDAASMANVTLQPHAVGQVTLNTAQNVLTLFSGANHGFVNGTPVQLVSYAAFPTGVTIEGPNNAGLTYYAYAGGGTGSALAQFSLYTDPGGTNRVTLGGSAPSLYQSAYVARMIGITGTFVLRNLTIGTNRGIYGIRVNSSTLNIDNCAFAGQTLNFGHAWAETLAAINFVNMFTVSVGGGAMFLASDLGTVNARQSTMTLVNSPAITRFADLLRLGHLLIDQFSIIGTRGAGAKFRIETNSIIQTAGYLLTPSPTVDIANNLFNYTNHQLSLDDTVNIIGTGSGGSGTPGGTTTATYFVVSPSANSFAISTTAGGAPVDLTSAGTSYVMQANVANFPGTTRELNTTTGLFTGPVQNTQNTGGQIRLLSFSN